MVNGDLRIGFYALCDIKADTELTFDYKFTCANLINLQCFCGSPNCRSVFGSGLKNGFKKIQKKN